MELWDNLLSSALLGTERSQPQLTADAPAVLRQITLDSPEHMLLTAAAVSAAYRRAGYIPPVAAASLDIPAPEETQPTCNTRSLHFLRVMLDTPHPYATLLPEWLEIIVSRGKRVPHPFLPALLEVASQDKKNARLLALIANVMGERGRWLAAQNSKWGFLIYVKVEQSELSEEEIEDNEAKAIEALSPDVVSNEQWANALTHLMYNVKRVWSQTLLGLFTRKMLKEMEQGTRFYGPNLYYWVVSYVPQESLPEFAGRLKAINDKKKSGLDDFIALLEFRRDMLQELAHE